MVAETPLSFWNAWGIRDFSETNLIAMAAEMEIVWSKWNPTNKTKAITDVDTNNNTTAFAVNLFLDSDRNGIPDSWEIANGLDPYNSADALLDNDGDGSSNLAELSRWN